MYTRRHRARFEFNLRYFSLREVRDIIQMVQGRKKMPTLIVIIVATFPSSSGEVDLEEYYQFAAFFWCEAQRDVESPKHANRQGEGF